MVGQPPMDGAGDPAGAGGSLGRGESILEASSEQDNAPEEKVDWSDDEEEFRLSDFEVVGAEGTADGSPCPVCLEPVDALGELLTLPCGHQLCAACFGEYVALEVKEGRARKGMVRCPIPECELPVVDSAFVAYLREGDAARHERLRAAQEIEDDPLKAWCPQAGCGAVVMLVAGRPIARCGACGTRVCVRCRSKRHPMQTCSMASDRAYSHWKMSKNGGVKRCPACKHHIEKDGGCRHMSCTRCGHEWCWICKAAWVDGRCGSGLRCKTMKLLGARFWGRSRAERASSKAAAVTLGVPLAIVGLTVTAGLAVAGAGVFAVALLGYGPVMLVKRARRRRAQEQLRRGLKAQVLLSQGVHLTLVGFPGLLEKVSEEVGGPRRGRGSFLTVMGSACNESALVAVTEGGRLKGARDRDKRMLHMEDNEGVADGRPRLLLARAGAEVLGPLEPDVHVFEVNAVGEVALLGREPRARRARRLGDVQAALGYHMQVHSPIRDAQGLMAVLLKAAEKLV